MTDRRNHGVVLILISALLTMLVLMAIAFVSVTGLQRASGSRAIDVTHARLLANSGFQRAISEFHRGADPAYGGEDWDGDRLLLAPHIAVGLRRPREVRNRPLPARSASLLHVYPIVVQTTRAHPPRAASSARSEHAWAARSGGTA